MLIFSISSSGVGVPDSVLEEKPGKYVSLPCHIEYAQQKREAKKSEDKVSVLKFLQKLHLY